MAGGSRKKIDRSCWRRKSGASRTEVEGSTEDGGPTQVGRKSTAAQEIGVRRKSGVDRKQRERLEAERSRKLVEGTAGDEIADASWRSSQKRGRRFNIRLTARLSDSQPGER